MKQISYTIFALAAAALVIGCITEYTPDDLDDHDSLLVVEGVIVEGETTIRLSKSVSLKSNDVLSRQGITDAQVRIEGENGERFDAIASTDSWTAGEYRISDVMLAAGVRYCLRISWNGEEYLSDYRLPQSTPPIKEIDFNPRTDHEVVQVRLDVDGEPGGSRHYLWSYQETWEIHANMSATNYIGYPDEEDGHLNQFRFSLGDYNDLLGDDNPDNDPEFLPIPGIVSPYYYCWKYDNSKEILLADTDRLTENKLKDWVLYEIPFTSDRLSALYHTKISLYSIGEDAYYYYNNQKKNTDQTGSIFAPIPSEMQGNIVCTTSPDVPVIGFVDVSKRVQGEIYLDRYDYPFYQAPRNECKTYDDPAILDSLGVSPYSLYLYEYALMPPMPPTVEYATNDCLDCRRSGGSKNRPAWWPNNHE